MKHSFPSRRASELFEGVFDDDVAAHFAQQVDQPGAGRVEADIGDGDLRPRNQQRRDHREGGGGGISGNGDRLRAKFRLAPESDDAGAGALDLAMEVRAEALEIAFEKRKSNRMNY